MNRNCLALVKFDILSDFNVTRTFGARRLRGFSLVPAGRKRVAGLGKSGSCNLSPSARTPCKYFFFVIPIFAGSILCAFLYFSKKIKMLITFDRRNELPTSLPPDQKRFSDFFL